MAITAAAGGGNWSAGGTWVGGVAPTAADDVLLTAASGNVVVDTAVVCRSLDCSTYTGTLSGTGGISVGDASGGAFKLVAGMTVSGSWTVTFVSTSNNGGTGWGVTSGGKTLPGAVTFNGVGGKWVLQDAFTGSDRITVTNGGFFGNAQTITLSLFVSSNSNIRTVDLTNCTVALSSSGSAWQFGTSTNMTFVGTGSSITLSGAGVTFSTGAFTYGTVVFSGSGAVVLSGTSTFGTFTRTGSAAKTDSLSFSNDFIVTVALNLNGNSAINRLLVQSNTVGTARVITTTGATVTSNFADYMDITLSVAKDLSGGSVGDCGGNSGITFTVAATQTHTASAGGNWSDVTKWTSRVPLPQDNVVVDVNTTGTLTADMPRLGKDLTFTGFVGTFASSVAYDIFGSLTCGSGMTYTAANNFSLRGRSSHTITSAGLTIPGNVTIFAPSPGTYTLSDAFATSSDFSVNSGIFVSNNFNMTVRGVSFSGSGATSNSTFGTSVISITYTTAVTVWNVATPAAVTISAASATIVILNASANTRTFAGGGKTYGTLTYTVSTSTGQLTITGDNTFDTINFSDPSNARTLSMPTATSTTFRIFNVRGTTGKLMTVVGDVDSTTVQRYADFLSINNSDATGSPWYAGANSTDGGSNTGWIFAAAPIVVGDAGDRTLVGAGVGSRQRSSRKERLFNRKVPYYSQHRGR